MDGSRGKPPERRPREMIQGRIGCGLQCIRSARIPHLVGRATFARYAYGIEMPPKGIDPAKSINVILVDRRSVLFAQHVPRNGANLN
jgi:hypothetical protein